MYNGYPQSGVRNLREGSPKRLHSNNVKEGVFTRGHSDGHPRLEGVEYLRARNANSTVEDLEAWGEKDLREVSAGDALFIRTGRGRDAPNWTV